MVAGLELKKFLLDNIDLPQLELIEKAMVELNYSKSHVKRTLYSMNDWSKDIAPISPENSELFLREVLGKYQYIFDKADEMADEVKHPSARVGALNVMVAATERMAKMLQSTGVVDKVASKVEMEVTKKNKILEDRIENLSEEELREAIKVLGKLRTPAQEM